MSKVIKNTQGLYLVQGQGFVAKSPLEATKIPDASVEEIVACSASFGFGSLTVEEFTDKNNGSGVIQNADGSSFAVRFVRPKDVRSDGSISARKRRYSARRFRTESEAKQHGARFTRLENHVGFIVAKVHEPVNAWVNEFTGRTNPEIGKARTDRQ
jgi:hypothetical protein